MSGGIAATGLQFIHGFELYLEQATLVYSAGTIGGQWQAERPLTLITNNGKAVVPKLKGDATCDSLTAELQSAVDAVREGKESPLLSGSFARDALELCYAEAKSITAPSPLRSPDPDD